MTSAARYLAAGQSDAIGGDWYEGLVLDDGSLAVVLGDVTGHGLTAAADMALIRGIILPCCTMAYVSRTSSRSCRGCSAVVPGQLLATAVVVLIDPATSTLTYATAGHPPPLLIRPDGTVERLDRSQRPNPRERRLRTPRTELAPFPRGATLILYTDGLVERRTRPFTEGIGLAVDLLDRANRQICRRHTVHRPLVRRPRCGEHGP